MWLLLRLVLLVVLLPASPGFAQLLPGSEAVPATPGDEGEERPLPVVAAPDEMIQGRLQGVFSRVEAFENIDVDVQEGVVYLDGTVERAEAKEKAERFALRIEGVLFVANQIEVQRDVEARITPAVTRLREFLNALFSYLPVLGLSLGLVLVFYGLARLATWTDLPFRLLGINPLLSSLLRRLLFILIFLAGIVVAIDLLDITAIVGAAIGTASIIGLALGFAFRDVAENYLAGVLLSIRRPFDIGDLVRIDTHEGNIVRMTSRELVLLTLDGNYVRLPNGTVFKSVIYNFTANPRRQFQIEVVLDPKTDLTTATEVGVGTLSEVNGVLANPSPFARVARLGETSVTMHFFGWVNQRETGFFKARSEATRLLKEGLEGADIRAPAPVYKVMLLRPDRHPPSAPPAPPRHPAAQTTRRSTSEEAVVDEQIQQDLATSKEENLLKERSS